MSMQTSVFENGEWVTRAVTAEDLIKANGQAQRPGIGRQPTSRPPTCGMLTRTIADSPVTRWILPVKLRSPKLNDVAFVGENFIQISELDSFDSQLRDVKTKRDFPAKIRSACIIGAPSRQTAGASPADDLAVKIEDGIDANMTGMDEQPGLPPQFLVLVLENGVIMFLFMIQDSQGEWTIRNASQQLPGRRAISFPGFHLAVDPTSRYLCLGYPEDMFIVCELESMVTLNHRFEHGLPLKPMKRVDASPAPGPIGHLSFLYPPADGDNQIILLLIMIGRDKTDVTYFEWEHGHEDVEEVLRERRPKNNKFERVYQLEPQYRYPLMVIPLTVRSAFILITENSSATISGLLEGSIQYDVFDLIHHDPTEFHYGTGPPLCVAWSRPVREKQFHEAQDVIYLIREDGIVHFLEVGHEADVDTSLMMGEVHGTFDTAFACMFDRFADVLLAGGDSGPGAIWNVLPRKQLKQIGKIPNWSPMVDVTVMNQHRDSQSHRRHKVQDHDTAHQAQNPRDELMPPDRVFACAGRGGSGTINEFRYGLEARVGLDFEYSTVINQCWVVTLSHIVPQDHICLLLSLPESSTVLQIAEKAPEVEDEDADQVWQLSQQDVPLDLASRTLTMAETDDLLIQITTDSIVILSGQNCSRVSMSDFLEEFHATISTAAISGHHVVFAARSGSSQRLFMAQVNGTSISVIRSYDVAEEITCLSLTEHDGSLIAVAGTWHGRSVSLTLYSAADSTTDGREPMMIPMQALSPDVPPGTYMSLCPLPIEPLTSIIPLKQSRTALYLAAGTRSGEILTIRVEPGNHAVTAEKFGAAPAHASVLSATKEALSIIVTNDGEPVVLTDLLERPSGPRFTRKQKIWATDAKDTTFLAPPINSVARMPPRTSDSTELMHLIMISGLRIMYSELGSHAKQLMRQFGTKDGMPTRMLYDPKHNALVTSVHHSGHSALYLFDPDTGAEISQSYARVPSGPGGAKQSQRAERIDGLTGPQSPNPAVRIACLDTWDIRQGQHTWHCLLLGCRVEPREYSEDPRGLLLVVKMEAESQNGLGQTRRSIAITRQFSQKFPSPVYAVTSHEHGVFVCSGTTIQYLKLDQSSKKLRTTRTYELPSIATSMRLHSGKLHVITTTHSLLVLDYTNTSLGEDEMVLVHSDEHNRYSLDFTEVGSFIENDRHQSVAMVSDRACGIHGLWSTSHDDNPLSLLFQAELRVSIKKFARADTRAPWISHKRQMKYGCLQSGRDNREIIGIGIDGSLHHFMLLSEHAWRLLKFIQNLATMSPVISPFPTPPENYEVYGFEPRSRRKLQMHVDGDILQQCFDLRAVEALVSDQQHATRLQQLLEPVIAVGGDIWHQQQQQTEETARVDFDSVYEILEYFLSPML